MNKTRTTLYVTLAFALAVALALPAAAAQKLADVDFGSNSIQFTPRAEYGSLVVTVTGDGIALRREFGGGEQPVLAMVDDAGVALPDGTYTWELRAAPTAGQLRARLRTNQELGDAAPVGDRGDDLVQSGAFTLRGGTLVDPNEEEPALESMSAASALTPMSAASQTIATDLIVQGSECVGLDCSPSESFGFDTLRLKENNLRINFDDTSSSGSFPSNDWRIVANDSANGGASYLSFEDSTAGTTPFRVSAGSGNNALYVSSSGGNVGLGTATPVVELQVTDGDSPTIRLEQNNSSGFTAQTWDIAGNETNFFVRDVTNSSKLPFRIRPGAPTSSIDVNTNGDIGVGTQSPTAPIHVVRNGSPNAGFLLQNTGGTNPQSWFFQNQSTNGSFNVTPNPAGTQAPFKVFPGAPENSVVIGQNGGGSAARVGIHRVSGIAFPLQVGIDGSGVNGNGAYVSDGGVWTDGSSRASKEHIVDLSLDDAIAAVLALQPKRYNYKGDKAEQYVGFIAEDVPDLVATNGRKHIAPMDVVAVLTKVVQAQQKQNSELLATVAAMRAELDALSQRVAADTPAAQ